MPARLAGWDYASGGAYFITVCAFGRAHTFGAVRGGGVDLSTHGSLLASQLVAVTRDRAGVQLDAWVVMPDHLHFIVLHVGETDRRPPVDVLVAELKATVTYAARRTGILAGRGPLWQRGFYDRVIRNDEELKELRGYIATNPTRWTLAGR